jgi:hypothetical protein
MLQLTFKVAANPPSMRKITLVQQQNPRLPDDEIDLGGPIVAGGEGLQMGEGDTLKLEMFEGGEPIAVLDQSNGSIKNVVSIPTAISFSMNTNGSSHPDGDWWGKDVLFTATIGGERVTRWLKFHDHQT